MNRVRIATMAIGTLLPAFLAAQQSPIKVRQGQSLEYNVRAELEVTEIAGDHEQTLTATTGGVAALTARRVSRSKIEWSYETPEVRLVRVTSAMEPGEISETTVQAKTGRVATDRRGRLVTAPVSTARDASLTAMMEAMHRNLVKLWFQPSLLRGKHPGNTWSETRDERLRIDEMGLDIRTRYSITWRFDGIVDTLGTKAVRVSWNAEEMQIDGTRTAAGVSTPVRGNGDYVGTSYFSTIDGLLLVSVSENSVDMRVSPEEGGGGVIPMTWRLRSESIRR